MLQNRLDAFFQPFRLLDAIDRQLAEEPGIAQDLWLRHDEATASVELDLPGVSLDAIEVEVDRTVLTITAERSREDHRPSGHATNGQGTDDAAGEGRWLMQERPQGSFRRSVRLPFPVDRAAITARYRDGRLSIELPRAETDKPARVAVTAG